MVLGLKYPFYNVLPTAVTRGILAVCAVAQNRAINDVIVASHALDIFSYGCHGICSFVCLYFDHLFLYYSAHAQWDHDYLSKHPFSTTQPHCARTVHKPCNCRPATRSNYSSPNHNLQSFYNINLRLVSCLIVITKTWYIVHAMKYFSLHAIANTLCLATHILF